MGLSARQEKVMARADYCRNGVARWIAGSCPRICRGAVYLHSVLIKVEDSRRLRLLP